MVSAVGIRSKSCRSGIAAPWISRASVPHSGSLPKPVMVWDAAADARPGRSAWRARRPFVGLHEGIDPVLVVLDQEASSTRRRWRRNRPTSGVGVLEHGVEFAAERFCPHRRPHERRQPGRFALPRRLRATAPSRARRRYLLPSARPGTRMHRSSLGSSTEAPRTAQPGQTRQPCRPRTSGLQASPRDPRPLRRRAPFSAKMWP